ncbi:MAG: hypothetical protein ACI9TH_004862 [Kiritimatiellia bacterium]|jgi:uncharacterized protein (TIGR00266 family)
MSIEAGWYIASNGQSIGPMSRQECLAQLPQNQGGKTIVYGPTTAGQWVPASTVAELNAFSATPPPAPDGRVAHEIDYEIFGDDIQYVEVTLDPNETVIAEAGTMMFMTNGIEMQTVMGDPNKNQGMFEKLLDAGKRAVTGESLFLTTFTAVSSTQEKVSFAAPYPGHIIPMHIDELGGELLCQKDAFLAAAKGTEVGIAFQKKIMTGLFGGEGFILQRLRGDGIAFVHAGGTIVKKDLVAGETLRLDTGCLVAFQPSVKYEVEMMKGVKNALFGGEGLFLTTLTGPGQVWIQSLPFSRLAGRMMAGYSKGKGEGSVIGGLSNIFEAS